MNALRGKCSNTFMALGVQNQSASMLTCPESFSPCVIDIDVIQSQPTDVYTSRARIKQASVDVGERIWRTGAILMDLKRKQKTGKWDGESFQMYASSYPSVARHLSFQYPRTFPVFTCHCPGFRCDQFLSVSRMTKESKPKEWTNKKIPRLSRQLAQSWAFDNLELSMHWSQQRLTANNKGTPLSEEPQTTGWRKWNRDEHPHDTGQHVRKTSR